MAFTVEDGTGLADSNAYVDAAYCDIYHGDRGHTAWTDAGVNDTQKEQAIVRATDHIDRVYGWRFRGRRLTRDQALEWPRTGAEDNDGFSFDSNSIPLLLQKATAEFALRALVYGVLTPDGVPPTPRQKFEVGETLPSHGSAMGPVHSQRRKVGPIEVSTQQVSSESVRGETDPDMPAAEKYLQELIEGRASVELYRG